MGLKDRTAVITGSTSEGIGRSTAFVLASRGADIVLNYGTFHKDKDFEKEAEKVKNAIIDMGSRARCVKADTRDENQVRAMIEKTLSEFGRIDILVNNAGGGWNVCDYTEMPLEQFKDVLAAEIDGAFLIMKYAVKEMRKQKSGRIINIGLDNALNMQATAGLAADYCLGKAARTWMTTAFGLQELKNGITVNCIEPGPNEHMSFEDALAAAKQGGIKDRKTEKCCAHDVAEIIAFLCSDNARFISGTAVRLPMV